MTSEQPTRTTIVKVCHAAKPRAIVKDAVIAAINGDKVQNSRHSKATLSQAHRPYASIFFTPQQQKSSPHDSRSGKTASKQLHPVPAAFYYTI